MKEIFPIKKIVWLTSDNQTWKTEKQAKEHQICLDSKEFQDKLKNFNKNSKIIN